MVSAIEVSIVAGSDCSLFKAGLELVLELSPTAASRLFRNISHTFISIWLDRV